jgi:hypothetical protein
MSLTLYLDVSTFHIGTEYIFKCHYYSHSLRCIYFSHRYQLQAFQNLDKRLHNTLYLYFPHSSIMKSLSPTLCNQILSLLDKGPPAYQISSSTSVHTSTVTILLYPSISSHTPSLFPLSTLTTHTLVHKVIGHSHMCHITHHTHSHHGLPHHDIIHDSHSLSIISSKI